jgi:hypothetical protein
MPVSPVLPRRRALAALAVAVAGAALVACGDDDSSSTNADKPAAAAPAKFVITAGAVSDKKLTMEFPATVKAGLVTMTLRNDDTRDRSAQILRITGDQTIDDVLKVVNADETKIPLFMQDGGGIAVVKAGETGTATQVLAPGRYAIWDDAGGDEDDAPGNDALGAKGEFTVTGPASDAELPAQPATVTATDAGNKDYGFQLSGLKAGRNNVRFENTGKQLHHALFFPIRGDKTIEQVAKAFESETAEPPVDFEKGVGTSVIDGGIAQNIELDLPAARYAVICFLSDRKGGDPHISKGMIEEITIK